MIRLSKLTDYGLVLMTYLARNRDGSLYTACGLAGESRLPLPTVTKLLKALQQGGLLISHRGVKGGYDLARSPEEISIAEIISVLEGPVALTDCSRETSGLCSLEPCCPITGNQRIISQVVRGALEKLALSDLLHPLQVVNIKDAQGRPVPSIGFPAGRVQ